jgi:periplasmic copper chaperone A
MLIPNPPRQKLRPNWNSEVRCTHSQFRLASRTSRARGREVSVVSELFVQSMSPVAPAASFTGGCKLRSRIPFYFSSRGRRRPAASFRKYQPTNSKPCRVLAALVRSMAAPCFCWLLMAAQVSGAQGEGLIVSDAWVPAVDEVGRDVPLLFSIRNETGSSDALMRVRCPVANFFEKHIVDRGEGAPAMRAISSIPVPTGSTVLLKPTEYHVMLLQIREPLAVGARFSCTLVFQRAGAIETEVEVRRSP